MAGDWIKMRTNLLTHPKIVRIASALKADRHRTVGGIYSVWCLFDEHSIDGHLSGYTPETLDELVNFSGICAAMQVVGWVNSSASGLSLPEFDTHNGQSAKRRAQEADRKRADRKTSADDADKKRTREEKRREEKNTPKPPKGDLPGFAEFWDTWPTSDRKQAKGKCLDAWKKADAERAASIVVAHVAFLKNSDSWLKDAGSYIPAPLVYLNQRRWEGANSGGENAGGLLAGAI